MRQLFHYIILWILISFLSFLDSTAQVLPTWRKIGMDKQNVFRTSTINRTVTPFQVFQMCRSNTRSDRTRRCCCYSQWWVTLFPRTGFSFRMLRIWLVLISYLREVSISNSCCYSVTLSAWVLMASVYVLLGSKKPTNFHASTFTFLYVNDMFSFWQHLYSKHV